MFSTLSKPKKKKKQHEKKIKKETSDLKEVGELEDTLQQFEIVASFVHNSFVSLSIPFKFEKNIDNMSNYRYRKSLRTVFYSN